MARPHRGVKDPNLIAERVARQVRDHLTDGFNVAMAHFDAGSPLTSGDTRSTKRFNKAELPLLEQELIDDYRPRVEAIMKRLAKADELFEEQEHIEQNTHIKATVIVEVNGEKVEKSFEMDGFRGVDDRGHSFPFEAKFKWLADQALVGVKKRFNERTRSGGGGDREIALAKKEWKALRPSVSQWVQRKIKEREGALGAVRSHMTRGDYDGITDSMIAKAGLRLHQPNLFDSDGNFIPAMTTAAAKRPEAPVASINVKDAIKEMDLWLAAPSHLKKVGEATLIDKDITEDMTPAEMLEEAKGDREASEAEVTTSVDPEVEANFKKAKAERNAKRAEEQAENSKLAARLLREDAEKEQAYTEAMADVKKKKIMEEAKQKVRQG